MLKVDFTKDLNYITNYNYTMFSEITWNVKRKCCVYIIALRLSHFCYMNQPLVPSYITSKFFLWRLNVCKYSKNFYLYYSLFTFEWLLLPVDANSK